METQQEINKEYKFGCHRKHSRLGKVLGGLIIIAVGTVLLAKQMGVIFPIWLFSWPMIPIIIGLYIGARHTFRARGWIIPVLIGSFFLVDKIVPDMVVSAYIWPLLIIAAGIFIMFSPQRKWGRHWKHRQHKRWENYAAKHSHFQDSSTDDRIDSVAVFGGINKNIISKDFKGGEITCFFGGAEINLSQADINGTIVLEATQVFGGTKLIVPANWKVQSEMVAVLGGIEDRRSKSNENADPNKVLILKGTSVFGGLEINSY